MSDVEEIIDYIKSLKKGFDKDLFENKINELSFVATTSGLDYEDFHTLFKVWLNLSIPITKWINIGTCMVPRESIEERTVIYALRWLLANYNQNQSTSFSRISFLLDWLTVAVECKAIDMYALELGYEIFYTMLTYEALTAHAIKLVYTLTKPHDVTRRKVVELLDYAKKRENKKSMYRQLQVLLGLFKCYKPECVPENIPAISIHTAFKKLNISLIDRFNNNQNRRNGLREEKQHLVWSNPFDWNSGRNKKAEPLIPNLEILNIGSQHYAEKEFQKSHLDFSDASSLLCNAADGRVRRAVRLRALLRADVGLTLLAAMSTHDHAFLSHDLHHLLEACFLNASPYSIPEKCDLLHRLAVLQRTLTQGIPVITLFLAQFLPLWNEIDYFSQILLLVEWMSIDCPEYVVYILDVLRRVYNRAQPMQQCAILRSTTNMYTNLAYASTRRRHYFMEMKHSETSFNMILPKISASINDMCEKALQTNHKDMRLLYSSLRSVEQRARCELRWSFPLGAIPRTLTLALPLLTASAAVLDKVAAILLLYRKIISMMKATNKHRNDKYITQLSMLKTYTRDMINCLFNEQILVQRHSGFVFSKLHPQLVEEIYSVAPDANSALTIRNNLAFAPYTYIQQEAMIIDHSLSDNKVWFDAVIDQEFTNLSQFLKELYM